MTDDRLQEIAERWLRQHGQCHVNFVHWAIEDSEARVENLKAALREVAAEAVREEREALRVWLAAESLPDCEACAKLDAATTAREALRPAVSFVPDSIEGGGSWPAVPDPAPSNPLAGLGAKLDRLIVGSEQPDLPLGHEFDPIGFGGRCGWTLDGGGSCGQPRSAHEPKEKP